MFGTNLMDRRSRTERITDDAWDHLSTFVDSARSRTTGLAGLASDAGSAVSGAVGAVGDAASVVGGATDEARRRAALAYDALAGRRMPMPMPWTLVIAAAALGAAIGWAAGSASRAALARMGDRAEGGRVDEIEFVEADRAKSTLDN